MFRLRIKRTWAERPGFVVCTLSECLALAALPDVIVLSDAYNPPGFPGSLYPSSEADVAAYEAARLRASEPTTQPGVYMLPQQVAA